MCISGYQPFCSSETQKKHSFDSGTTVHIGFILNLENLENRPFLHKIRENLEYSGNVL